MTDETSVTEIIMSTKEQKVQESDTRDDAMKNKCRQPKKLKYRIKI